MIVRVLGEGRYEVPAEALPGIESLDETLGSAIEAGDETAMTSALADLITAIRAAGTVVAPDDLRVSELVVPHEGSSLDEVVGLLAGDT